MWMEVMMMMMMWRKRAEEYSIAVAPFYNDYNKDGCELKWNELNEAFGEAQSLMDQNNGVHSSAVGAFSLQTLYYLNNYYLLLLLLL